MEKVNGIKVTLQQIIDSSAPDAGLRDWVVPKKATILSNNYGTLVEVESGELFLVPRGSWFRSPYQGNPLPQVTEFNKLQDYGLTAIKDKIIRNEEKVEKPEIKPIIKPEIKPTVKLNGQEIRKQDNVGSQKVNQTMATNIKSEEKK